MAELALVIAASLLGLRPFGLGFDAVEQQADGVVEHRGRVQLHRRSTVGEGERHLVEIVLSSDGNYRYVVSATDPGVPNWLDADGLIVTRWQGLTGPAPAAITTTVVPIDQVRSALAGEPTVTPAQRDQALARRAVAMARRFF